MYNISFWENIADHVECVLLSELVERTSDIPIMVVGNFKMPKVPAVFVPIEKNEFVNMFIDMHFKYVVIGRIKEKPGLQALYLIIDLKY